MNRDSEGLTEQSRSGSNFMHSQSSTDQGEEGGNGDIPEVNIWGWEELNVKLIG